MTIQFLSPDWKEYALIDSGSGRKLEQFGAYRLIRPEDRAVWKPAAPDAEWQSADAEFVFAKKGGGGAWQMKRDIPEKWQIRYKNLSLWLSAEQSRQVGIFPENAVHWDWIGEQVRKAQGEVKVLNLFGYTGAASLAAAAAGASVTHIDSSRRAITTARENQELNRLNDRPIRWIVEDALKFAEREVRRGNTYEGIIFDPPKYGLGPKRERWAFFENYEYLCQVLAGCISDHPSFVVVTAYALESPPEVLVKGLDAILKHRDGRLELGSLTVIEKSAGRKIDLSITGRWSV